MAVIYVRTHTVSCVLCNTGTVYTSTVQIHTVLCTVPSSLFLTRIYPPIIAFTTRANCCSARPSLHRRCICIIYIYEDTITGILYTTGMYVFSCFIVYITLHHIISYHIISCRVPHQYHTIPYHTIPYHTISYHTIPYHTTIRTTTSELSY